MLLLWHSHALSSDSRAGLNTLGEKRKEKKTKQLDYHDLSGCQIHPTRVGKLYYSTPEGSDCCPCLLLNLMFSTQTRKENSKKELGFSEEKPICQTVRKTFVFSAQL